MTNSAPYHWSRVPGLTKAAVHASTWSKVLTSGLVNSCGDWSGLPHSGCCLYVSVALQWLLQLETVVEERCVLGSLRVHMWRKMFTYSEVLPRNCSGICSCAAGNTLPLGYSLSVATRASGRNGTDRWWGQAARPVGSISRPDGPRAVGWPTYQPPRADFNTWAQHGGRRPCLLPPGIFRGAGCRRWFGCCCDVTPLTSLCV
jgi:hypothetical protein